MTPVVGAPASRASRRLSRAMTSAAGAVVGAGGEGAGQDEGEEQEPARVSAGRLRLRGASKANAARAREVGVFQG